MSVVYCMKTLRELTSMLCSVHEAVGLIDLKLLSCAFKHEVNTAWISIKDVALQQAPATNIVHERFDTLNTSHTTLFTWTPLYEAPQPLLVRYI